MTDELLAEGSKFALVSPASEPLEAKPISIDSGNIPWGYNENRITVVVRDPDSVYLYWEITDPGLAAARARLGSGGRDGWCNLRVYDTSGRHFDGTNAHDYFDIRVDRAERDYFLMIRRPMSTMHAEIGIKSHEGFFQAIARSGRADFPRNGPSPNTTLEWMTLTSDNAPPAVAAYRSRYAGSPPQLPGREGAGYIDVWRAAYAPSSPQDVATQSRENASWSGAGVHRTFERSAHIERWWHLEEWRAEWRGGLRFKRWVGGVSEQGSTMWRDGPFPVDLFDPARVAIELLDGEPVHLENVEDGVGFTVFGPWRVTVHGFESDPQRRVIATWSMRWVRASTPLIERWGYSVERQLIDYYENEHTLVGASERHALLQRGASERWRLGGSEQTWMGASEWNAQGGSETVFAAGAQWGFAGASALLY
ncbi:MAG: DUF4912 domain-containing protein, partial [Myxococcota bacterium]|nr:DUF4912 domain-containing protein [Myxococcota bacterium]